MGRGLFSLAWAVVMGWLLPSLLFFPSAHSAELVLSGTVQPTMKLDYWRSERESELSIQNSGNERILVAFDHSVPKSLDAFTFTTIHLSEKEKVLRISAP